MTEIQTLDERSMTTAVPLNDHQQTKSSLTIADVLASDDFDYESLVTEDDEPVDNIASEKQQRLLTEPLYTAGEDLPFAGPFLVLANVGLFYHPQHPPVVPDVLFSLGVEVPDDWWMKQNRSYFVSQFGKLPEVVVEIVSNKKGNEDSTKLQLYSQIGVPYYVIFDSQKILSQDVLRVYKRDNTTQSYRHKSQPWFPEIRLGLKLWSGTYEGKEEVWLRWCDARGIVVPTGKEGVTQERLEKEKAQASEKIAQQQAELEYQRAELERQRAELERQQKEQLIVQLKALGIEPKIDD